jgi:hypothetical protein
MQRDTRDSDDFTQVQFPIRIGEYRQFNDGLVGYWLEAGAGYKDDLFYAPQSNANGARDEHIRTHQPDKPLNLYQTVADPPQILAMLIDPRGKVHATCGILPTKAIDIPPDQYSAALQAIQITFLSAPILSDREKMRLPLPAEPGYTWSWLENKGENGWAETLSIPTIKKELFLEHYSGQNGERAWQHLLDPKIGWLRAIADDASRAIIIAKDARQKTNLAGEYAGLEDAIQGIFDLCQVSLGPVSSQATFSGPGAIREGWLKLSVANEQTSMRRSSK